VNIKAIGIQVVVLLFVLMMPASNMQAAETVLKFENDEQSALYLRLTQEFRCLKCQNQNLADSSADLAKDLRNEIYQAVLAGQGRDQIAEYLVARYGDFVLYRPPMRKSTYLLWFGPFALLLVAIVGGWRLIKRKPVVSAPEPSDALDDARRRLSE